LQGEVHLQRGADSQDEFLLGESSEALKFSRESIWPGHESRNQKRPVGAADRLPDGPAFFVSDDDQNAGQNGLLLVSSPTSY
jgi:hypothetical protein